MKIIDIEGIGPALAEKLKQSKVTSVEKLLEKGADRKGRHDLATTTGIDEKALLRFVNHADLMRIKGVGGEYSELLEAAGVDTVAEPAQRRPENLYATLLEVNRQKKLVRHLASQSQVERWVEQARKLPRVVNY